MRAPREYFYQTRRRPAEIRHQAKEKICDAGDRLLLVEQKPTKKPPKLNPGGSKEKDLSPISRLLYH